MCKIFYFVHFSSATVPKDQQKVLQALHEVLVHKVQEAGLFVVGFQDNSEPAEALQMNDRSTELLNTNSHDLNATVTVASPCDSATKNKYFTGLNTSDYAQRRRRRKTVQYFSKANTIVLFVLCRKCIL